MPAGASSEQVDQIRVSPDVDQNLQFGHERVQLLQLGILFQRLDCDGRHTLASQDAPRPRLQHSAVLARSQEGAEFQL